MWRIVERPVSVWRRCHVAISGCPAFVPGIRLCAHGHSPLAGCRICSAQLGFLSDGCRVRNPRGLVSSGGKQQESSCFRAENGRASAGARQQRTRKDSCFWAENPLREGCSSTLDRESGCGRCQGRGFSARSPSTGDPFREHRPRRANARKSSGADSCFQAGNPQPAEICGLSGLHRSPARSRAGDAEPVVGRYRHQRR